MTYGYEFLFEGYKKFFIVHEAQDPGKANVLV